MTPRACCAGFLAGFLLSVSTSAAVPPELPVEELFAAPALTSLQFSPDGKSVLFVVPHGNWMNLVVVDLEKGEKRLVTNFNDRHVESPLWANNRRILYLADDNGQESYSLYAVDRDGADSVVLATGRTKAGTANELNPRFRSVLQRLPEDPEHVLVLANLEHYDWSDVARLNIRNGRMTLLVKAPGEVEYYTLDRDGNARFAVVRNSSQRRRVLYRPAKGGDWQEVFAHDFDTPGWEPLAFDGDGRTAYVLSNLGRDQRAIYRYDTETRVLGEMVVGDATYDLKATVGGGQRIFYDRARKKVLGFSYEAERTQTHWLDPDVRAIHAKMEQALPDTTHSLLQVSEDGRRLLFYSHSDRDPGVYYLFDRDRGKLSEIAVVHPQLSPEVMAPVQPVAFTARDGLTLHGYLTLPVGREPRGLPLVVHPHGGPYGVRDHWRFDPEVQFYANRGFAVLQVNFRGSGGYGDAFEGAGYKEWGLKMQDDLSDGVAWVVGQGIADAKRVVISGASYGGYATMAGLVYTPELYAAGINYVGVVDIPSLIPKSVQGRRLYWMNTRIADLSKAEDRKRLEATSPVNFADRIRVPLLMAYGKNDPRVPINQAYDIERALKRSKVPYQLIIEEDEGHGFRNEEKRIAFFRRVDAFLKEHILTPAGNVQKGELRVVELPVKAP